jgi:iron complex outermembrane receptor protein
MAAGTVTAAALVAAALLVAQTGAVRPFDVAPGPAVQSINRLAAQGDFDVVIATPLAGRQTRVLRGRMTSEAALERLLAPLGARAVRIGDGMYRIEAAPLRPPGPRRPLAMPPRPEPAQLSEIIVTAMPPVGLGGASGGQAVDGGGLERLSGSATSETIADLTATVDSTRQGVGRNKLFVRGLADSALNGPLQATVGQYLGDLRLNYGSPDPDLALIDIRRVEVFEGPQGARFGAGSIGGVLRLQPEPPQFDLVAGRVTAGASVTSGGAGGGDASLILNQPLGDAAAGRLVAYARREGGFLDNPGQGVREADGVDIIGGRAALRWTAHDWTFDLIGVAQRAAADDAQTIAVGETRFAKAGRVLEPYESEFALAGFTASRRFGTFRLISATSFSRQSLNETFDASQPASPWASQVDRRQTAVTGSSELRIVSDPGPGWTWSGGAVIAAGETLAERRRTEFSPDAPPAFGSDLKRRFAEAALFGEASISPASKLRVAVGARLSAVRIDTDVEGVELAARAGPGLSGATVRISPSVSARWDVTRSATLFARLEEAVRPAGVSEAGGAFERYRGDRVTLAEVGVRSNDWRADLSAEASIGWADWRDVQADIVSPGGDLVTDNVGDGVIRFISIKGAWIPAASLNISGGLFLNDSRLTATRFSVIGGGTTDIPNVAPFGAQASIAYEAGTVSGAPLRLGADLRYIGHSRLGVGPMLDAPQGGYLRTELTARLGDDRRAATLRVSNPFDTTGYRYGIGSPYQLAQPQAVPVRPLTIRLSFESAF